MKILLISESSTEDDMSWKKRCYSYYINCHKTYDLECELNRLNYINVLLKS